MSHRFLEAAEEVEQATKPGPAHPKGWEPHVVWDGRRGQVVGRTTERPKDWSDLITSMGLDPAEVEVVEPVQMRWWDANVGDGTIERLYYAKANVRRKRQTDPDIGEIIAGIGKAPRTAKKPATGNAYVFGASDWQLGKKGTAEAVDRLTRSIEHSAKRLKSLRSKRSIGSTYIIGLGDIGEACSGHYDMQTFTVELDGREQSRLARNLIRYAIEEHRGLTERIVVPAVAGNHGEKRSALSGKAYTTFGDNLDLEVFEQVAEAYEMAKASDVSFVIPQQTLSLVLDIGGVNVGIVHGHQAQKTRGDHPSSKLANWWTNQIAGQRPVTHADLLFNGHFHQHWVRSLGPRTNIAFPTTDSGSQWWDETAGLPSTSGSLTLVVGRDYPNGFGDISFD